VGLPVCWAAFELLPVAAVCVPGVLTGHPLGKFGVEGVGEVGDVAQGGGQAGAFGEGVLLETVLGYLPRDGHGPVQQIPGRDEFAHHAECVGLRGGEGQQGGKSCA